jgi:hypothetical protein
LPLIFCVWFYKKLNTKALKAFFIYAAFLALFSVASVVAIKILKDRSIYLTLIRLFTICEYIIIATIISRLIKNSFLKKVIFYSFTPFVIYAISDYIISHKIQYNNYINLVSSLSLIVIIIYFFYEKMQTVIMYPLYQSSSFWICVGFFLYFTGTFFFFLFIKSSQDKEFIKLMNIIYGFVTVTKNILLCVSLFANEHIEEREDELQIPTDLNLDEFSLTTQKNP